MGGPGQHGLTETVASQDLPELRPVSLLFLRLGAVAGVQDVPSAFVFAHAERLLLVGVLQVDRDQEP